MTETMTYADASRCPGCRHALPAGSTRCPACGLTVRHPLAQELFATLQRADELVAALRQLAPVPPSAPAPPTAMARPQPDVPRPPATQVEPVAPAASRSLRSVPKILLGLGALCLLVAAVIFLAVSWTLLGVGGRTAVLVGLTAGSGTLSVVSFRHDLRIGAEAFAALCLGLLVLDLTGADASGWLGDRSAGQMAVVVGLALVLAGAGFARVLTPGLVTAQLATGLGAVVAWVGAMNATTHDLLVGHLALAAVLGGVWLARRWQLAVATTGLTIVGGLIWLTGVLAASDVAFADLTLRGLWVLDGSGWSALVSGAALVVPGILVRHERTVIVGTAGAALLATGAVTAPALDETARVVALVVVAATTAWLVAAVLLPARIRVIAMVPAVVGSLLLTGIVALTAAVAAMRWADLGGVFVTAGTTRLSGVAPLTEPLVVVPAVAVVVAVASLLVGPAEQLRWWRHAAFAPATALLVTVASYEVPLASVVAVPATLAVAALVLALTAGRAAEHTGHGVVALVLGGLAAVLALPSAGLTALVAGLLTAVAGILHPVGRTAATRVLAGLALAPAAGLIVVAAATAGEVDPARIGVPLVVLAGLLALLRPRPEVEAPAALVALLGTLYAVPAASDAGGSLALHLTVAGSLVAGSGLLHAHRRPALVVGGGLLLLASWVRLADLGVSAPEPYTLPLATLLLGAGLWRLRRHPEAATLSSLSPGLGLALVPTLLWALADPISLRALLLGAGCVALVLAGAALRWQAPLVAGAVVAGVLVLRELAPYALVLPQWIWIGLAGVVLTAVGVTWERRLQEVRLAARGLGRLR